MNTKTVWRPILPNNETKLENKSIIFQMELTIYLLNAKIGFPLGLDQNLGAPQLDFKFGGAMILRKTNLVKKVESQFNRPLERLLPEMINERGVSATADFLGVKKSTLNYWILKLGINVQRVVLAPGESVEVKRSSRL